jgi:hypothetical protein
VKNEKLKTEGVTGEAGSVYVRKNGFYSFIKKQHSQ